MLPPTQTPSSNQIELDCKPASYRAESSQMNEEASPIQNGVIAIDNSDFTIKQAQTTQINGHGTTSIISSKVPIDTCIDVDSSLIDDSTVTEFSKL